MSPLLGVSFDHSSSILDRVHSQGHVVHHGRVVRLGFGVRCLDFQAQGSDIHTKIKIQ